ncbi:hypothetical protein C8F04DRAFT_1267819 [Mycena alexandri]|uniref:Uncharacterized protein n=1 Tax=Mycena alexandri TaxID=1745969 RepID=A0AAD6WTP5_9AGAR|nr:hypothetical protein C8F04DRAFT_1267819 [Mycena alexandri]
MAPVTLEGMGTGETVSCTVVAFPGETGSLEIASHCFPNLHVSTTALDVQATNTVYIDLSALLAAIFLQLNTFHISTGEIPDSLHELLTKPYLFPRLRLATTRVPIFDGRMQNPTFGYRSGGYFTAYIPSTEFPTDLPTPSTPVVRARAINLHYDVPETRELKENLLSLEIPVRLEYHFILIFSDYGDSRPLSPPTPYGSSPFSSRDSPLPNTPGDASNPSSPFTPFTMDFTDPALYSLFENVDSGMGIGSSNTVVHFSGDSNSNSFFQPSHSPPQPAALEGGAVSDGLEFIPSLSMPDALLKAGVTAEMLRKAMKKKEVTHVWGMFHNHGDAKAVLDRIGFPKDAKMGSSLQFTGGLNLTLTDVLKHLGWCERTFTRKSGVFNDLRTLATYTWKDPSLVAGGDGAKMFALWQAIVAMFSVGGFVDRPHPPRRNKNLLDDEEKRAASLTQNQLLANLPKLTSYLQPPT